MPKAPNSQLAQQWSDRLRRFERSSLTVAEFCQLEGYSVASFYQWCRRLRAGQAAEHSATFVPVQLPRATEEPPHHGGFQIELPDGALVRLDHDATDEGEGPKSAAEKCHPPMKLPVF